MIIPQTLVQQGKALVNRLIRDLEVVQPMDEPLTEYKIQGRVKDTENITVLITILVSAPTKHDALVAATNALIKDGLGWEAGAFTIEEMDRLNGLH